MSFNSQKTHHHYAVALAALLIFTVVVAGCGTDEDKTIVKKETPAPEKIAQADTKPQAPSQPMTPESAARVPQEVTYEIAERAFLDGRYDEAVDLFTRYTEKKLDNSFGHYMLGLSAWKDGRLDVAEGEFQKSLMLDP